MKSKYRWLKLLSEKYPSYIYRINYVKELIKKRRLLIDELNDLTKNKKGFLFSLRKIRIKSTLVKELEKISRTIKNWFSRAKENYLLLVL